MAVTDSRPRRPGTGTGGTMLVRAAGGVVWRRGDDGRVEVLLVHRPLYDDWTLPKTRARAGEPDEECARRGVEEQTGLVCSIGPPVRAISYDAAWRRRKLVRFFAVEPQGAGAERATGDADEALWVPAASAARVLSYPREVGVVEALRRLVGR